MKTYLLIAFILAALAQLSIPLHMAWKAEVALSEGTPVLFRLQGVDPYDPMRGKYVRLSYAWGDFALPESETEVANKRLLVCAHVAVDENGFGTIKQISLQPPEDGLWFRVPARQSYRGTYRLQPTFDRYFVNEGDASAAEQHFFDALRRERDLTSSGEVPSHAILRLLDGEVQLEDVIIDGQSLAQLARDANGD